MINNPKDIQEVLNIIDNVTKEQLDEAIRRADEMNEEEIKLEWDYYETPEQKVSRLELVVARLELETSMLRKELHQVEKCANDCKDCIKEYHFRKARGNEDDK